MLAGPTLGLSIAAPLVVGMIPGGEEFFEDVGSEVSTGVVDVAEEVPGLAEDIGEQAAAWAEISFDHTLSSGSLAVASFGSGWGWTSSFASSTIGSSSVWSGIGDGFESGASTVGDAFGTGAEETGDFIVEDVGGGLEDGYNAVADSDYAPWNW